jgi:predicted permease
VAAFFSAFIGVVLPVFAVAAVGYLVSRYGKVDSRTLTTLLMYVSVPGLLFDSLAQRAPAPQAFGQVALAAAAICLGAALVAFGIARLFRLPHRGLVLTTGFMNAGNFGLPFTRLAFGEAAFPHAVTFYVTMAMLQSTLGIWVAFGKRDGWKEALRVPMIHAAIVGISVNWLQITLPVFVAKPAALIGQTGIPLMLLALGHTLGRIRPKAVPIALFASLLRIGGGLALAFLFVELFALSGHMRHVALLLGSMPPAVMNVVLAERYQADSEQVATTVLFATLMAAITVPVVINLAR